MLTTSSARRRLLGATTALASAAVAVFILPASCLAQAATALPTVPVDTAADVACPLDSTMVGKSQIDAKSILGASDTATLLSGVPGVALSSGGGISSLPIVHGMADDRNKTLVDGVPVTSACPNHMNPALSYIAPTNTGHVAVIAGITPVSSGGDSIGSTITVDPPSPMFAKAGETYAAHGSATTAFRSIDRQITTGGDITAATQDVSLGYSGSWTRARDSHDGDGDRILASSFESQSHNATLAARGGDSEVVVRGGHQITPYEGFPNQRMDLTGNTSNYLNLGYDGDFNWGKLDAKVYWQNAKHEMNFLGERNSMMPMPMNTDGTDAGYSLKAELPVTKDDTLRLGNEYHSYRLSDWWPPVKGVYPSMGNNTFQNINEGSRDVLGTFAELEKKWTPAWTSVVGVRNDIVWMNTGDVAGYSSCNSGSVSMMNPMMSTCSQAPGGLNYARDSAAFNAQNHQKTDTNFDVTATTQYEASTINTDEAGFARKTRSPNLYERYAWSTGTMASSMINWTGNGADYVGNINLRPETANTASVSTGWHDAARQDWDVKLTPYYTYVQNYIGVDKLILGVTPGVNQLQFANHDAQLFGFDLSGSKSLVKGAAYGDLDVSGIAGFVKGMQVNNGNSLYHMQPINADISLNHHLGNWASTAEVRMVDNKSVTNPLQNEQITPGFAVLNWRTSYQLENITFAFGIDNLLNKQYYDPNGGADVAAWRAAGTAYDNTHTMDALPASGRSFNAGVTVKF
ncbi:MAG TPA: TonB-dependent receptor [Patescibacteria group bacterium]|nr:TonB-dependent receptor [Patescibacteria group bacterium]